MSGMTDAFNAVAVREDPSEAALKRLNLTYTRREDGRLQVETSIDFRDRDWKELPDLSNVVLIGDFHCNMNFLTNLKGAPYSVSGHFLCSSNWLETMEGAPQHVGGDFRASSNRLENLAHMPRHVGGTAYLGGNHLHSLEGIEDSDVGILDLTGNIPLKDLEVLPRKFGEIHSDFGNFTAAARIPAHLRVSETTRARIRETANSLTGLTRAVIAPKTASFRRKS